MTTLGGPPQVFMNRGGKLHWLVITLRGTRTAMSRSQLARVFHGRPETLTRVVASEGWTQYGGEAERRLPTFREFRAGEVLADVDAPRGHVNLVVHGQLQIALAAGSEHGGGRGPQWRRYGRRGWHQTRSRARALGNQT